jgi:hypothetical protein
MSNEENLVWRLSELEVETLTWLWPGRLALGKSTVFDGDPGLGKSLAIADLAARLTVGRALPDGVVPAERISVVLVGTEDGVRDTVLPRLLAAGADVSRVHVFAGRHQPGHAGRLPSFPEDERELAAIIGATQARLVVLDPLMAFLNPRAAGSGEPGVRRALGALARVAQETGAAMIWVRHLNKGGGAHRALYRGSGSIAIIGAARSAFLVAPAPSSDEGLRVLACTKNNLSLPPPALGFRIAADADGQPVVVWTGPVDVSADDLVLAPGVRYGEHLDRAKEFLQQALAPGPRSCELIQREAAAAGLAPITLRRAKQELHVASEQRRVEGRSQWFWSLTERTGPDLDDRTPEGHARKMAYYSAEGQRYLDELVQKRRRRLAAAGNPEAPPPPSADAKRSDNPGDPAVR